MKPHIYLDHPIILEALNMHSAYLSGLKDFHYWMQKEDNKVKAEIATIIYQIIEIKKKGGDQEGVFPTLEDLESDKIINYEELQRFNISNTKFHFSQDTLENNLYKKAKNLDSFFWKNYHNEYMAYKLCSFLTSEYFLKVWNELSVFEQAEYYNMLSNRLSETKYGSLFLSTSQLDKKGNFSCFHYSYLKKQVDYINDIYGSYVDPNNVLNNVKGNLSDIKFISNVTKNIIKISPIIGEFSEKIGNEEALRNIRKVLVDGTISIAQFTHADFLKDLGEFKLKNPEWNPKIAAHFEHYFKWFKIQLNEKYFPLKILDNGKKVRIDNQGVFTGLNFCCSLINLQIAFINWSVDKGNKEKIIELGKSLIESFDDINEVKILVSKNSKGFIKTGGAAFKFLKTGAGVASLIGVVSSIIDANEAFDSNDISVGIGNSSLALAGLISTSLALGDVFLSTGVAFAETGIGIEIGIGLGIAALALNVIGFILIRFTKDPRLEKWFQYNSFGRLHNSIRENEPLYTPTDFPFRFSRSYHRQIIKFNTLLYANDLKLLVKIREEEDAFLMEVKCEDLRIFNNQLDIKLNLWNNDSGFIWNYAKNLTSLSLNDINSGVLSLPDFWGHKEIFIKTHQIKFDSKFIDTEEKIRVRFIGYYRIELLISKELILKKPEPQIIVNQCEVTLIFSDKESHPLSMPKKVFVVAAEVSQ